MPKKSKEETFVERTNAHIQEHISPLITNALLKMWEEDVNAWDVHYIEKRVRLIMEQLFDSLDFDSPEIKKLRKEMFRRSVEGLAKKKVKLPKDKDALNRQRDEKCEPVCLEVVKDLLNSELLESDDAWFEDALRQDEELLAKNRIRGFTDGLFAGLELSLNTSLIKASNILWGCEREDVTMKQVDSILKTLK